MASSILKGLVANYGKLGYQLWHRPFKMASLVYEREIGGADSVLLAGGSLRGVAGAAGVNSLKVPLTPNFFS